MNSKFQNLATIFMKKNYINSFICLIFQFYLIYVDYKQIFFNVFSNIFFQNCIASTKGLIMQLKVLLLTILVQLLEAQGSKNLLINGNFSYEKLPRRINYRLMYNITGWTSVDSFQIFNAATYNNNWPNNSQIAQIAISRIETLCQVFQSDQWDYYNLSFEYAAYSRDFRIRIYEQIRVFIKWNGVLIEQLCLTDVLIHNKTIKLMSNRTTNQILFFPKGSSDGHGIGFTNIEMIGYCNVNRTNQNRGKCIWNPIPYCLLIEQATGNCSMCQNPFTPSGRICQCQPKFYFSENSCKPCLFPCEDCQGSPRNCLTCAKLYTLQENQCKITAGFTQIAVLIVSLPGFKLLSVGQILLGNLNQFWPYYSHHRQYGYQTDEILTFIHTLQNNKWFLLSLEKKIDFNFQTLDFSDYGKYSNQKFLRKQNRTSFFWDGAFQIFFFTFPVYLLIFFFLRKIFYLTFKYRISRHFRLYSFFFTIYIMLFEGDISFLSFVSFNNALNLFTFKFQDKIGHALWILVSFLLILFCVGGFLLVKILYKRLAKHFLCDFSQKMQSFNFLSFLYIKELIVGALNAFLATKYELLIISLGLIEIIKIVGLVYFQRKHRCYKIQTFMYFSMLKSIFMVFFNILLWLDWNQRISDQQELNRQAIDLLDYICRVLIIIIIGIGPFQIISSYFSGRKESNYTQKNNNPLKSKKQILKMVQKHQKIIVRDQTSYKSNLIKKKLLNNDRLCSKQIPKEWKNNKRKKQLKQVKDTILYVIRKQNRQQNIEVIVLNIR